MAFIQKLVGTDEKLIGVARLHWIYALKGLAWLVGLVLISGLLNLYVGGTMFASIGRGVFWVSTVFGITMFVFYYILMMTTELGLTDQRIIYKRGLIFVKTREIDLEEIKSASIDNGYLGRILNYGFVILDSRFVADISLPAISDPYRFIKALNHTREQIKEDSMHVVLEQKNTAAQKVAHGLKDMQEKNAEFKEVKNLSHDDYGTVSDSPKQNMKEIKAEAQEPKNNSDDGRDNKKQELFVHEEALHDKVIDDFNDLEQGKK